MGGGRILCARSQHGLNPARRGTAFIRVGCCSSRAPARRLKTGDPELQGAVGRDWQNDYADFSIRLKKELQGIESASERREALARMSEVLRSYQRHRDKRKARNG